jgi:4-hydroxy-4-methyl-2-oxoglutarate aldolase
VVPADLAELATRFSALYTGAITDVLDRHGYRQQTLPPSLRPLREGMRLAGPAFPVEGRPRRGMGYDTSIRGVLTMLGEVPAGYVVVYQTHDTSSAHLGELSVTSLKGRACAGAVIDGGCRDVEYVVREGFPVFSRYVTPQDCVGRWEIVAWDVLTTIGGVGIEPGDYLVADSDGVVVVPAAVRDVVLEESEEVMTTESEIRAAVRAGALPLSAYERYGKF